MYRSGEPWSDKDHAILRIMAKNGFSARETGQRLGRSRGAVAFVAMREKVSFHKTRQPKGVQQKIQRRRFRKGRK